MADLPPTIRLDKFLWHARFFKTRSLATREVQAGHIRVNAVRTTKPAHPVGPGDVLTFATGARIRVVRILALGDRRGPAPEAAGLYDDLSPPAPQAGAGPVPDGGGQGGDCGGRPRKKDRRAYDRAEARATRPDRSGRLD